MSDKMADVSQVKKQMQDLHKELMVSIKSPAPTLQDALVSRVNKLGPVTQDYLMNSGELNNGTESLLGAACIANKTKVIDVLLKWYAKPTPETMEGIIRQKPSKDTAKMMGMLLPYTSQLTIEYAFLLSCLLGNLPMVKKFLELGMPFGAPKNGDQKSMYADCLRDTLIYVASRGDITLARTLDPCIVMSSTPLFETLYLTAAFYGHQDLVQYFLDRMGASPEARMRGNEILSAHRTLIGKAAEAKVFKARELELRKREAEFYDGDVKGAIAESKRAGLENDPYFKALAVMEKHFRHRHEFQEALLIRPYSIEMSIYTLDTIMHAKEVSSENLNRIKQHLVELSFEDTLEEGNVMKALDWVVTAMGYIKDEHNPLLMPDPEDDDTDEDSIMTKQLKKRLTNERMPPVEPAPYRELAEFACWVLMRLEKVSTFDEKREWHRYLLRRVVRMNNARSRIFSLPHRLLEMHFAKPGKKNVFQYLAHADVDLTAIDKDNNTLLHKAVEAFNEKLPTAKETIEILHQRNLPLDIVNSKGVSVANDVRRILNLPN